MNHPRILANPCEPLRIRRRSAHVGDADLTLGNENVRSRLAIALPIAAVHAARTELKQYTQHVMAGVLLQVRSKKSKVRDLESVRKSEQVSDLRRADRGGDRDGATAAFRSSTRRLLLLRHDQA